MNELELATATNLTIEPPTNLALQAWERCSESHDSGECPLADVLDLIKHKWTVHIIHSLHRKEVVRFREIQRLVAPITQKELTKTLRQLETAGLITRRVYAEVPPKVEYRLTELGLTLVQPLAALTEWAEYYLKMVKIKT